MVAKKRSKGGSYKTPKINNQREEKKIDHVEERKIPSSLNNSTRILTFSIALLSVGVYFLSQDFSKSKGNDTKTVGRDYAESIDDSDEPLLKETLFLGDDSYEGMSGISCGKTYLDLLLINTRNNTDFILLYRSS